jgi:hypothetical protein
MKCDFTDCEKEATHFITEDEGLIKTIPKDLERLIGCWCKKHIAEIKQNIGVD